MHATRISSMRSLVYRANHVVEKQKALQADHRPTYQILPRAKLYMVCVGGLLTFGLGGSLYGTYKMIRGTHKA